MRFSSLSIFLVLCGLLSAQERPNQQAYTLTQASTLSYGREALPLLDSAQQICRTHTCADSTLAFLYRRLGVSYFQGFVDDDQAILFADTARIYYERYLGTNHPLVANQYYTGGIMKREAARRLEAINSLETAISILEQLPPEEVASRDSTLAHWYHNLAFTEITWGDYASGVTRMQKAQFYNQRNSQSQNKTSCLIIRLLALQNFRSGNFAEAYQGFAQVEQCLTSLPPEIDPDPTLQIAMQNLQAVCIGEMGQLEEAIERLKTVAQRYRALEAAPIDNNVNLATTLHDQSWYQLQLGYYSTAKQLYAEARQLLQEVSLNKFSPKVASLVTLRGQIAYFEEEYTTALAYFDEALQLLSPGYVPGSPLEELQTSTSYDLYIELFDYRARSLAALGQYTEAHTIYEWLEELVLRQRQAFRSGLSRYNLLRYAKPAYEQAIQLNLYPSTGPASPQQQERAWQYVSKNKGVGLQEDLQQERALSFANIPRRIQKEEEELARDVRQSKADLYEAYQNDQSRDSILLLLADQEQAYYKFLQQLEQDYPRYYDLKYATAEPPQLNALQAKLTKKQLVVEYFWGVDSLYIFMVTKDQMQVTTQPVKNGLADSVRLYYELLSTGVGVECEQQFTQLSHFLYRQLIPPSLWLDKEQLFDRLLIIPDGLLHLVSFESLLERPLSQLNGSEGFLLERFAISYLPSVPSFLAPASAKQRSKGTFLGFGLEYDDATLAYLSDAGFGKKTGATPALAPCQTAARKRELGKLVYSDDEVQRVAERLGGDAWLNTQATKQAFLEQASNYDILHLAMHGTYDLQYPLNSSLLFSYGEDQDVALRAAEIYGLDLQAEMVVLSACNTGYGLLAEGEGVMSLARAFNYAGSNSMVASLWTAVDYSTAEIMVLFYDYLDEGLPKDQALQQAKLDFLRSNTLSSPSTRRPYHWAAAIVIGDTAPLTGGSWPWWPWAGLLLAGILVLFMRRRRVKE